LNKDLKYKYPFGYFFDKIRVETDERTHGFDYEWTAAHCESGKVADCVCFKIFSETQVTVKILLHRSFKFHPRYTISPDM